MGTPFKMKGFSGFGNSPAKQKKKEKWESYYPLSPEQEKKEKERIAKEKEKKDKEQIQNEKNKANFKKAIKLTNN